jgi:capsular polysaccharide biosynthesis protein
METPKPRGVTRRAIVNVLETFFRQPLLHLLPLVLLMALGVYSGLGIGDEYRSVGVINATSGNLLSDLTTAGNRSFGYLSPAAATSRNINDLLGTELFLDDVIASANISGAIESGSISRDDVRMSVGAYPRGDNLVILSATTANPELSRAVAQAVSDSFINYVIDTDLGDQQIRVETYEAQLEEHRGRLEEVTNAYEDYMLEHPIADEDDRPFAERLAIERLQQDVERATAAFLDAQANLDDANLSANVARTVVSRQLRVVDVPNLPASPLPNKRQVAMTIMLFTALGAVLSLGFVVARSLLDRTVRTPEDVSTRFGVDLLAVVPRGRR